MSIISKHRLILILIIKICSWIQEFGEDGLQCLLGHLRNAVERKGSIEKRIQHECVRCLKAFMNNKVSGKNCIVKIPHIFYGIVSSVFHDFEFLNSLLQWCICVEYLSFEDWKIFNFSLGWTWWWAVRMALHYWHDQLTLLTQAWWQMLSRWWLLFAWSSKYWKKEIKDSLINQNLVVSKNSLLSTADGHFSLLISVEWRYHKVN